MVDSPSHRKRPIADESEQLRHPRQNSEPKRSRSSYSRNDNRETPSSPSNIRGELSIVPSRIADNDKRLPLPPNEILDSRKIRAEPCRNQVPAIIPSRNKDKGRPLPPNTILNMIKEIHSLLATNERAWNYLFHDQPEISIISGHEGLLQREGETVLLKKACTWQQLSAFERDYQNTEATKISTEKAIITIGGKGFHTTTTKNRDELGAADNYLTDSDGRLILPIDKFVIDESGSGAQTCIDSPASLASLYFAIQTSMEHDAGILANFGVDSAEKRYKQLLTSHLSINHQLCFQYSKNIKFKEISPDILQLIHQISVGAIGSYNRDGFPQPAAATGGSRTTKDSTEARSPTASAGPKAAAAAAEKKEATAAQPLTSSSSRRPPKKRAAAAAAAAHDHHREPTVTAATPTQHQASLSSRSSRRRRSSNNSHDSSHSDCPRKGPQLSDEQPCTILGEPQDDKEAAQLLSTLVLEKKKSMTNCKGKAPPAISHLHPELGDRPQMARLLELALEKIAQLEEINADLENVAKSRPPQAEQHQNETDRFSSPGHPQAEMVPPAAAQFPGEGLSHTPGRPSPHPPPNFSMPSPIPRQPAQRTLTQIAERLYDEWGPRVWRDEVEDEPRIVQLAGDMRTNLTRCVYEYMYKHGLHPTSHLGSNLIQLDHVLKQTHIRALRRFKKLLDNALHPECQTPTRNQLSIAANEFLQEDKYFWRWVQRQGYYY